MAMTLPQARNDELIVKQMADETLVYDLHRKRAHCLNAAAGLIWGQCDGQTDVDQMAKVLERELGLPRDEDLVQLGLAGLDRAHLLVERLGPPILSVRYTRRRLLRQGIIASAAAILLPTVISIVAPTAAQAAATCVAKNACLGMPLGTPCDDPDCTNICCSDKCRKPFNPACAGAPTPTP